MKKFLFLIFCVFSFFTFSETNSSISTRFVEKKLQNGMTLIYYKTPNSEISSIYLGFKAGSRYDEAGYEGESQLLERLAFKGTVRIGSKNFDEESRLSKDLEDIGDQITLLQAEGKSGKDVDELIQKALLLKSKIEPLQTPESFAKWFYDLGAKNRYAKSSKDFFEIGSSFPKESLEAVMAVEGEWLVQPAFRNFYEERAILYDYQNKVAKENLTDKYQNIYSDAFGKKMVSRLPNADKITIKKFREYFKKALNPKFGVIVICGDYSFEYVSNLADTLFGKIVSDQEKPLFAEEIKNDKKVFDYLIEDELLLAIRKDSIEPQIEAVLDLFTSNLFQSDSLIFPDKFKKQVSRGMVINGDLGLCPPNLFLLRFRLKENSVGEEARKNLRQSLEKDIFSRLSPQDYEKIKRNILKNVYSNSEKIDDLARSIGEGFLISGDTKYFIDYTTSLEKMTQHDANRIANSFFTCLKE